MTSGPRFAEAGQFGSRRYVFPGIDYKFPSVTTVINQLAAPALEYWKRQQVAFAAWDNKEWRDQDRDTASKVLMTLGQGKARRAADFGTSIHEMIEDGMSAEDGPIEAVPYLVAAAQVIQTLGVHWGSEVTVVSQEYGFAGTADVFAHRTEAGHLGELCITDWKTTQLGKHVGYRSHQLQLAALAMCSHYANSDGELLPLPADVTQLQVVGLRPDGTSQARKLNEPDKIEQLQAVFLGLLSAHRVEKEWPSLEIWSSSDERTV